MDLINIKIKEINRLVYLKAFRPLERSLRKISLPINRNIAIPILDQASNLFSITNDNLDKTQFIFNKEFDFIKKDIY